MKLADSPNAAWSFRALLRWLSSSGGGCVADAFVPRLVVHPVRPSSVAAGLDGGLTASSTAASVPTCLEPTRLCKAEGKTKGGGTLGGATPVCTWGRRGTPLRLRRAAQGVQGAPMLATPRALHARPRSGLPRTGS